MWVRDSPSVFAFPSILTLHTIGMGVVAGLSAAVDVRILGVAAGVPLTEAQRLDLQRRVAAHEANPGAGSSWEVVKARLREKS